MNAAVQRSPIPETRVPVPGCPKVSLAVRPGPPSPLVPAIKPSYVFRPTIVEEVAFAIEANQNCMLVGDAGSGKSSLVEQFAALANRPLRRVNLHGETDTTLFVGRDMPTEIDGKRTLAYRWGILATAMRDGHWLLLDEIDAALQPVLFVLQGVLEDDGKLLLEDSEGTVVHKHPDFRIFATANTVGIASRNKVLYSGTMSRLNEATLDRFGVVVHVEGLEPEQEKRVIKSNVPKLDDDFIEAIVRIAHETRTQLKNEAIASTMSTRRLIQWAKMMEPPFKFHPLRAAQCTVLNKLSLEDSKVVAGIVQRFFQAPKAAK